MSSNRIAISPDEVKQIATEMSADVLRYKESYEKVYKASDDMKGHWEGKDVAVYHEKLAGYKPKLSEMEKTINDYIAYLNMAEKKHRETLNDNMGRAQGLPG